MNHDFKRTHPWLTFDVNLKGIQPTTWILLGEAVSKVKHVANAPIDPKEADSLYNIFLAKGAAATTAIEGNTLSEEQVREQVEGKLALPPSQEYLQREVQNIIDTCNDFVENLVHSEGHKICVNFVKQLNSKALAGLELEEGVVAGEIRRHSVVVGGYRGAPADECYILLEWMCDKINELLSSDPSNREINALMAALFAHVYIALIRPFGDGNGRTSRLLEVYILLRAGFPMPTCQLLSNHYNKTRSAYYLQLGKISKVNNGDLTDFVTYAVQGFVDGLREQVEIIQGEQIRVTWVNYIHERFREKNTLANKRRRDLALEISKKIQATEIHEVLLSNPKLNREYSQLDEKTLTRDLNFLIDMGIVVREKSRRVRPNTSKIIAFLPWRNNTDDEE